MTNLGRLMVLVGSNCKVIDISTNSAERDKKFSIQRKMKNYAFDVDFEKLMTNGFHPSYMHIFDNKDEIVVIKK